MAETFRAEARTEKLQSIIQYLGVVGDNQLWCKREDLLPFSFGGNKARKAELFFREIDEGGYDCVVTYGSGSSNHCRIVANHCCRRGLPCRIISPEEASEPTFNSQMMELFGAEVTTVPVARVHDTIENTLQELRDSGKKPYFIEGGGHGNTGTEAYVQCYREILDQEREAGIRFDYIFFASGTGTTHAGLVCGSILNGDDRRIVGISIARKNPRGRNVVLDSIRSYLGERAGDMAISEETIEDKTVFLDEYTSGYGRDDRRVLETIENVMKTYGIPMDATYTGKAFAGMTEHLKKNEVRGKKILFIHTGGTPLFFDALRKAGGQ